MHTGLTRLLDGESLPASDTTDLFGAVIRGELTDVDITALLIALKLKGETAEEIAGAALALRSSALEFPRPSYRFADIVGTGGDGSGSINISTAVAFVAAEAGLPVAKHGNRSVSSQCGSADLLELFGVRLDMSPDTARHCLDQAGVTFLFAPHYHRGVRHVMPVRKQLATRTVFNLIGPLVNPARPPIMLVGVYDSALCVTVARTLVMLGCERALVVNGLGLDEIALHGETHAAELSLGSVITRRFSPGDFGVAAFPLSALAGGDPAHNARAVESLLSGQGSEAHNAAVAVNTAALLQLAGLADTFAAGYTRAREILATGGAWDRLQRLATMSRGH
ncbi:MAG: anthranilate phosphoribosyltransferase [Gemmatimonadota bacterium]